LAEAFRRSSSYPYHPGNLSRRSLGVGGSMVVSFACLLVLLSADSCLVFLRGEGGDDFLEARVAAQRIPKRQQFQFAIADATGRADGAGKLFEGEAFFANPGSNHCQVMNHEGTIECVLFRRKKLDGAPSFAQRFFFPPKSSVD